MALPGTRRALACATLLALGACGGAPDPARHLVVITLDTFRADRVGAYGNPRGLTPALDRIASEGTRLASLIAPMPCTLPAHTALFTGLSPRRSGVASNFVRAPLALETLAERLAAAGFATAAFTQQFDFAGGNLAQGFQTFEKDDGERAERIVPALEAWLGRHAGEGRLFAWIHLFVTHGPLDLPEDLQARFVTHPYDGPLHDDLETMEGIRRGSIAWSEPFAANYRDRYDAAAALADARVAEVRRALERAGLLDATLLVIAGDHGESLEDGVLGLHSPVIREATLHVPALLRGPGIPAGRTLDEVAQHMDLFPTMLAALGLVPSPGVEIEGRDLTPLLVEGARVVWSSRAISILPQQFHGKRAGTADLDQAAIRDGRYKLVLEGRRRALFDLESDPDETHDLSAERPELARALDVAFLEWMRATHPHRGHGDAPEPVSPEMQADLQKLGYE